MISVLLCYTWEKLPNVRGHLGSSWKIWIAQYQFMLVQNETKLQKVR